MCFGEFGELECVTEYLGAEIFVPRNTAHWENCDYVDGRRKIANVELHLFHFLLTANFQPRKWNKCIWTAICFSVCGRYFLLGKPFSVSSCVLDKMKEFEERVKDLRDEKESSSFSAFRVTPDYKIFEWN